MSLLPLRFFWCLTLCAVLAIPSGAQTGDELLGLAYDSYDAGQWAKAKGLSQKAAAKFKSGGSASGWIQAQLITAYCLHDSEGDILAAQQALQRIYKADWLKMSSEEDHYRYCKALLFDGWLCKQSNDFETAKARLERAYSIFKKHLPNKGHKVAGDLFADLGNAYVRLREYQGARQVFEENIVYSAQHPDAAKFNDYGSLFLSLGDAYLDTALAIFQRGLDFARKKDLPAAEVKLLLLNRAECLAKKGRYAEALRANQAAEVYKVPPTDERYDRCVYGTYENYGIIYAAMGRSGQAGKFPLAVDWYKKAIHWMENMEDGPPKRELAGFYMALGDVWQSWGKSREALEAYQGGLTLLLPGYGANPPAAALYAEAMLIRAFHGKAKAFAALGEWEDALACYEAIPIVEAKLRANHSYESSSLQALRESRLRFQEAVSIAWKCYEDGNGAPQFAERAFRLAEWSRGMLLLQGLSRARKYLPEDVRQRDHALQQRIANIEREIASERGKGPAADMKAIKDKEKQVFALKIERQQALSAYPAYNSPDSLLLQVAGARQVFALLRGGQAMVDYFFTENAVFVFSFEKKTGFRWRKVALPALFRQETERFAHFLWAGAESGKEAFLAQARILDSLLFEPERRAWAGVGVSRVVVVPDDVLVLVPFEALTSQAAPQGAWASQKWLLRDYSFSYAYSASLLAEQMAIGEEQKKDTKGRRLYGGFAPNYAESGGYSLTETYPMAQKVKEILGGGEVWGEERATEAVFKREAPLCRILLLAMHGLSDNEQPELSKLLFGGAGAGAEDDTLYASELQVMRLRAELAFLSACHSGAGKLEQGEGVYSLARAFTAARVPATVMSLWLLQVSAARPLVEGFFRHLKGGMPKDEALRTAKLEFLEKNGEMAHPFYWAGLAAVGDMGPLGLAGFPVWPAVALAAFLAAAAIWLRRRRP